MAGFYELAHPNHQVFKTDKDGRFTWPVPEGPVSLYAVAHKDGLAPAIWMKSLDVEERGDHIELKLGKTEPFAAMLVDTAGHPVTNARVRIEMFAATGSSPGRNWTSFWYVRREVIGGSPLEAVFETTTDRNGLLTFRACGPGKSLRLAVTPAAGGEMRVRAEKEVRSMETTTVVESGFVAAPPGELTRLVAFPAARVKGRVVTTLPGVSVAGMRVYYQSSRQPGVVRHSANFETQKVTTEADGQFVFDGLNEGTINVLVHGRGEGESWTYSAAHDVVLNPGKTAEVTFELTRGADVEGKVVAQGSGRASGRSASWRLRPLPPSHKRSDTRSQDRWPRSLSLPAPTR